MTEFDQLIETLVWATGDEADGCEVEEYSKEQLFDEYQQFVDDIPLWIIYSIDEVCLTGGDVYEQLAHDYIMTRMGHGVGFWETSDWEEEAGQKLTELCKKQGMLESYVGEDEKVHVI